MTSKEMVLLADLQAVPDLFSTSRWTARQTRSDSRPVCSNPS